MTTVREKVLGLQVEMNAYFKERREELQGLVLALLTQSNICIFGPKGTAKSLMARMICGQIDGAVYWERLFTRFTVPEEVFGPVKISALKNDSFERRIEGHLPRAHIGFADEIFKANSSILNSLLSIINEKLFHNDGAPEKVPLEVLIGASNELPGDEALVALYDRFLLRYKVGNIAEDASFIAMLKSERVPKLGTRLSLDEIHAAQDEVGRVVVPDPIVEALVAVRRSLATQGITSSDRRYRQSLDLVRAKAWLMGRTEAVLDDLAPLVHVLWDTPEQRSMVQGIVLEVSNPLLKTAEELYDAVQVAWGQLQKEKEEQKRTTKAVEVLKKINDALGTSAKAGARRGETFPSLIQKGRVVGADMVRVEGYVTHVEEIKKRIHKEYLNLDE